jgi:RimJ/RimL family protein N-acetyltransferase
LILRAHVVDDFEDVAAMWGDPEVVRHITGTPADREASWARLLRYIGHWNALGFGYWAVERKEDGRYLGSVGFADYQRSLEPAIEPVPEAGWGFVTDAQGQGFGIEAVQRMHDWASCETNWSATVCIMAPDHDASRRLAEKVGYRPHGQTTYKGDPTFVMWRDVNR